MQGQCTVKLIVLTQLNNRKAIINAVKRVLYSQQCLEEHKAEIENNVESFMQTWVFVYDELKNS